MSLHATTMIVSWAGIGAVAGAALGQTTRSTNAVPPTLEPGARSPPPPRLAIGGTVATALLFGVLAWRLGPRVDLLAYSVLAAAAVPLSVIDWYEMRLPRRLVLPLYPTLLVLLWVATVIDHAPEDFLRAVAGMGVLATSYLATAILSRGGLGAGDVVAAGPIGLMLAWLSWSTLLTGSLITLFCGAATALALRSLSHSDTKHEFPFGPAMFAGTFIAVLIE